MVEHYIPGIEEFHVGFECEFSSAYQEFGDGKDWYTEYDAKIEDDGWIRKTVDQSWLEYLLKNYTSQAIKACKKLKCNNLLEQHRVKYLDRKDIESLGFKFKLGNYENVPHKGVITNDQEVFTKSHKDSRGLYDKVDLIYNYKSKHLLVVIGDDETSYVDWQTIFAGIIRNKNEIKVLLKQLNNE